jgi:hypothetical protein
MPQPRLILIASFAAAALAGCGPDDKQAPAPTESLVPLPSEQPAPPAPGPAAGAPEDVGESAAAPQPSVTPAAEPCGADRLGDYLNLLPTSDAMDKIRDTVGHDRIRAINPGDVVTQDLRPDRLNIEIGVDGRIKHFRCG